MNKNIFKTKRFWVGLITAAAVAAKLFFGVEISVKLPEDSTTVEIPK